jgi:hypothetical protein
MLTWFMNIINFYAVRSTVPSLVLGKLLNTNRANVLMDAPLTLFRYKQVKGNPPVVSWRIESKDRKKKLLLKVNINPFYTLPKSFRSIQYLSSKRCDVTLYKMAVKNPLTRQRDEGCPERIQPFWISREPVAWPWCNLAASQREETLLCIHEQSLSRGASQSAVRRRWLSLCTVRPSHSQISSLSTAILDLGKATSSREPNMGCRGADRPGWCDALSKSLREFCIMGRRNVEMKLICTLGQRECDGYTVHKLS